MTLNAMGDYYQILLYKDPFNFVGVLVSEGEEGIDLAEEMAQIDLEDQPLRSNKF